MPVLTLTPTFLSGGLIVPEGKARIEYCDATVPGLLVEVRANAGAIPTYYLRYKRSGKTAYDRLGTIKDLTLTQTRKLATQKKVEHAPLAKAMPEQKSVQGEMTLDVFWTDHALPHLKLVKRSFLRDEQLYRRIAPKFGSLALNAITRYSVELFKADLMQEKLSPASVDHHLKLFRHLLNLAVQWDMLDKNPLKGFQLLNVDNAIENYLQDDGLTRFLDVLRTDPNRPICLLLMFLLSTGARLNEAVQARWSQIDIDNGVWKIPASNSKSKKTRSVPLNDSALWVLEQAKLQGDFSYPFANSETGLPYQSVRRVFYRLCEKAQVKLRIHDLRHSFASLLVSGGRSLYEVQQILGHSDPKVTMRYAHLSTKALQEAANAGSVIVPKSQPAAPEPSEAALAESVATTSAEQQSPKLIPVSNVVRLFQKAA
jgi:integrase